MRNGEQEKLKLPVSARLLLGAGAVTVYNVFAHHQTLIDLSRSIHWLASYWRYVLGVPFEWLHLNLSPLQREAIVLLMFCISAALSPIRRHKRLNLYQTLLFISKPMSYEDRQLIERIDDRKDSLVDYIIFIFFALAVSQLMIATMFPLDTVAKSENRLVIQGQGTPLGLFIFLSPPFLAALWMLACITKTTRDLVETVYLTIAHSIMNFMTLMSSLYRPIVSTWKLLLLLLILDVAFKFTLDPLLEAFPTLPCPPNLERC